MAEEKKKYPFLAKNNWWKLRKKFRETYPKGKVTDTYLASVLDMSKRSAQNNVIPELKLIGLINDEGKPTDLANKWRIDEKYAEVCEEIKKSVYPSELLDAVPDPVENREVAERWFMQEKKVAEKTAKRMTAFYILVSEANPSGEEIISKPPEKKKKEKAKETKKPPKGEEGEAPPGKPEGETPQAFQVPSIHIDLQIHISPEAKLEQIDKLFESMAKHLKDFYISKKSK